MVRIAVLCVVFLAVVAAVPSLAQAPASNIINCSSGTTCKKATIPVFTIAGGAAKVDSSIVSQSGTTVSIAGSETVRYHFVNAMLLDEVQKQRQQIEEQRN